MSVPQPSIDLIVFNGSSKNFFVKPQIKIYGLNSNPINVTVTNFGLNTTPFRMIVWTLQIENIDKKIISSNSKFIKKISCLSKLGEKTISRNASNCAIAFNTIDNNRTRFPQYRSLRWRTLAFPAETHVNISHIGNSEQERRDRYLSQLPSTFIGEFLGNNSLADLPKKTGDILLFFTVEGLNSLYFISHDGIDVFREEDVPQLTFPFTREFELRILFQYEQPNYSKEVSYKVIPTTWDYIRIEKIG